MGTNSIQERLQTALNKTLSDINSWFKANFLLLNFNTTIANVTYTKFLGLVIDETLTWDNHIDQLISRLNSVCYAITAVKAMLPRKALRKLYFS